MEKDDLNRQDLLIEIILDPNAEAGEKDDAAMDLAEYNNKEVLDALIKAAITAKKDEFFLDACGESIAQIWIKNNEFDLNIYLSLPKWAQTGIYNVLKARNPELVKKYNLEDPFKNVSKKNLKKGNY